jgi:hypothetical protein
MEEFLHAEHLHTGFHRAELLHADDVITPAGADQGWRRRPLQYRLMEPSPLRVPEQSLPEPPMLPFGTPYIPRTQVDLGRLARPPEGTTPFTVAGLVRAPTREQRRVIGGGAPDKEHGGSHDHRSTGYTIPQSRSIVTDTRRSKPSP